MRNKAPVSERAVADLIEQVSRVAHGDAFSRGLNPAQWMALRYFGRANRFSRTVSAFAEYQGTTRGTASQTVKALVTKECLAREPAPRDRRSFHLEVTVGGRTLLENDPIQELTSAIGALTPDQRSRLAEGLGVVLSRALGRHGRPRFGVCSCCCHLRLDACHGDRLGPHECGLLGAPLDEREIQNICVSYSDAWPT